MPSNDRLKCSFCGKTQDQVKKLIAGPDVFICDECVDLCNEILDEELLSFRVLTEDGMNGVITEVFEASPGNKILRVMFNQEVLISMNSPMIKEIHKNEKYLVVELINGM